MLRELSSRLEDNSIYHIVKFDDGTRYGESFFVVDINEHGFVKADIIFPNELDVMNVLPKVERIHYHEIGSFKATTTEITEKVRIKVVISEYTKQIILEADDQCWYVGVGNADYENSYYTGTLKLLLFTVTLSELHNGETGKAIYPSFYKGQYRYLNHKRRHRYRSSFKSEEEKVAYEKWERMEDQKCSDEYIRLLHYSHPKRYENDSETFKKWAKETETRYQERNERLERERKKASRN